MTNPLDDPFCRPDTTLDRINSSFKNLKNDVELFLNSCEYERFLAYDADRDIVSYRARLKTAITPAIAADVTDIMRAMKDVLDQALNASLKVTTGTESTIVQFPTGKTNLKFEKCIKDRCCKPEIHATVIDIIKETDCFESGNANLYQMTVFATHRHKGFIEARTMNSGMDWYGGTLTGVLRGGIRIGGGTQDDGSYEYFSAPFGTKVDMDIRLQSRVFISEPIWMRDKDALEVIHDMIGEVTRIYKSIKSATMSIL